MSRSYSKALRVVYIVPDTPLFGGIKVILQHADLLVNLGHHVTISGTNKSPDWRSCSANFMSMTQAQSELKKADIVIATFWTTLLIDLKKINGKLIHFCQGYEGSHTHNQSEHAAIQAVYEKLIPAISVSPHLAQFLQQRFAKKAFVTPPVLDDGWSPSPRIRPRKMPRILIVGPWEIDWKGVTTALLAVQLLRTNGMGCQVIRLSQWPQAQAERDVLEADEFHEHISPRDVPEIVRSCDLLLCPSWEQEGFGLPVLEAMASGVPVVASDISSFNAFASRAARLVPADSASSFASAAELILNDTVIWWGMRLKGLLVARQFSTKNVGRILENTLLKLSENHE